MGKLAAVLAAALGLSIGGMVYLAARMNELARAAVEAFVPKLLGAPVRLQAVSLSPLSGRGELRGLVIGNPPGFSTDSAFTLDFVRVALRPRSLFSGTVAIDEIHALGPQVTYEMGLKKSNIGVLLENARRAAPAGDSTAEASPRKLRVRSFALLKGRVRVGAKGLGGKTLSAPLPDIRVQDIGGEDGATPAEAAVAVLEAVYREAAREAAPLQKQALESAKGFVDSAKQQAQQAVRKFKGLFGKQP